MFCVPFEVLKQQYPFFFRTAWIRAINMILQNPSFVFHGIKRSMEVNNDKMMTKMSFFHRIINDCFKSGTSTDSTWL